MDEEVSEDFWCRACPGFKAFADQHTALGVQVLGLLALQLCTGKILESAASTRTL